MAIRRSLHAHTCQGLAHEHDTYANRGKEALKRAGLRLTQPRLAILHCLARSEMPLSARAILENVNTAADPRHIDQVSVYRVMETLLSLGLVHQVFPSGNYMRCHGHGGAAASELHVVLQCRSCGRTSEQGVEGERIGAMVSAVAMRTRFNVESCFFQIDGLCAACSPATPPHSS